MADSYTDFTSLTSDQQNGIFTNLTTSYISTAHFSVTHTDAGTGVITVIPNASLTIVTTPTLNITVTAGHALLPFASADLVRVSRTTPVSDPQRTFSDGSVLKASDLNTMTNQLLFGLQENADGGVGSLPLDTDDKYNAGGKVIKNLGEPTLSNEAVTKTYVDNMALYGSAFGGVNPQSWTFTAASGDISGNDRVFTLETPGATSTEDSMYLVEAGGVMQTPADYNVTEVGGTFTLTMLDAATGQPGEIANGVVIVARNFGVSRNIIIQPLTAIDADDTPLTLKGFSGQAANLLDFKDNSDTLLASVDKDGDATFPTVTASTSVTTPIIASGTNAVTMPNEVNVGDLDVASTTTSGAKLKEMGDRGRLDLQQTGSADATQTAFQVRRGTDKIVDMDYGGNLNLLTGALQLAGNTQVQILQIRELVTTGTTSYYHSNTSHSSWMVSGLQYQITPARSDSTLLLLANYQIFSLMADSREGGKIKHVVGNTAAPGGYMAGVDHTVGMERIQSGRWTYPAPAGATHGGINGATNTCYGVVPFSAIYAPGSVDPLVIDVVHKAYDTNVNYIGVYHTGTQKSHGMVIEYLNPS